MLTQQIIDNWDTSAKGYAAKIISLFETGYPAWTIKTNEVYGVAIPLPEEIEVAENFSGAKLYNDRIELGGEEKNVLLLITDLDTIKYPFATLCAELITPGENGIIRKEIENNPVIWWMQWKELLGNKNIDERVYDALGELCVLKYLVDSGKQPIWNGPDSSTYDIECDLTYYEVKSTIAREKRQITLNNHFQLDPPNGKELKLILCQFEPSQTGYNINSIVDELAQAGYSKQDLNHKLELLGLEKKKSARKRCYALHAMIKYDVDDTFPAIRESSFIGGVLPKGIQTISYTLSLDGVNGKKLENSGCKDGI